MGLLVMAPISVLVYVPVRGHFIRSAYDRVHLGDSRKSVESTMGSHFMAASDKTRHLSSPLEYQYFFWPAPQVWVIAFKDDVVTQKEVLVSP